MDNVSISLRVNVRWTLGEEGPVRRGVQKFFVATRQQRGIGFCFQSASPRLGFNLIDCGLPQAQRYQIHLKS